MVNKMEKKEDIDFVYSITYPAENHIEDEDFDDVDGCMLRSVSYKEPVVVLLGWMGAKNRSLQTYSAVYEAKK